ncbi:MAG: multidrug effflux MFS transporter [Alphaproteobacteria bacterium]
MTPSPSDTPIRLGIAIAFITMAVALGPISTDLYLPSLPSIGSSFGTDAVTVQLTLSVFLIAFGVSQLFYGPLSDRFGRRPALLTGLAIYTTASLACWIAPTIEILIVARFFQALGGCAGPVIGRAAIRDVYGRVEGARVLAYVATAMALAPAAGPVLGGFLEGWFGWRANFLVLTLFGGIALAGIWLKLPETNRHMTPDATRPKRIFRNFGDFLAHPTYRAYAFAGAFSYCGLFCFISASPLVFIDAFGVKPEIYGFCFAAIVVGYMAGTQFGGRLVRRFGVAPMTRLGAFLNLVAGVAMTGVELAGFGSVATVLPLMVLYMIGLGIMMPNALAGLMAPFPERAGAATAFQGFSQFAMAAVVGIAVTEMYDRSALPMAIGIAAMGLLAVAFCFRLREEE